MRSFILLSTSLTALMLSTAISAGSAGAATTVVLPDCEGKPSVRPQSVVLACGDGNVFVSNLTWSGWGNAFAAGLGVVSVNDCTPNCASGHAHRYKATIIVEGRTRCPDGSSSYAKETMAVLVENKANVPPFSVPLQCSARPR